MARKYAVMGVFFASLFGLAYLEVLVAIRSSFFLERRVVSFGNDVMQGAYIVGMIGSISAFLLWRLGERGKWLRLSIAVFVVVFAVFVGLNRAGKVCMMKKAGICTPVFLGDDPYSTQ